VLEAADADLVILQEAFYPALVEELAQRTRMASWAALRGSSLAFLSRAPVSGWEWHRAGGVRYPFLEMRLDAPPRRIFGVHLYPSFSLRSERMRIREIGALLRIIAESQDAAENPHLIVGDFNAVAPGDEVKVREMPSWIRGLVWLNRGRVPREAIHSLLRAGYIDGFRQVNPQQEGFTLPAYLPKVRLDYVFLSPLTDGELVRCEVISGPEAVSLASDHLPLLAVFDC
jgi:endonuclease/exonuclease/phosphatase family metal-dependent hydrolase